MKRGEIKGRIRNGSLDGADLFLLLKNRKNYKFFYKSIANSKYIQNYEILDLLIKVHDRVFGNRDEKRILFFEYIFLSKYANEEVKNQIIKNIMKNKHKSFFGGAVYISDTIIKNSPKGSIDTFAKIYKVSQFYKIYKVSK